MENPKKIAYEALLAEEQNLLSQLSENRVTVERLAAQLGEMPPSLDMPLPMIDGMVLRQTGQSIASSFSRGRIVEVRPTEFFNASLAGAVMSYLDRVQDNAAPFQEILSALRNGGFQMKNGEAEEQRLRLNLLKSTRFKLIPPDTFGLSSIYDKARKGSVSRGMKAKTNEE